MRIIVSPVRDESFLVEVQDTGTVSDLKHEIYIMFGYIPQNQTIVYKGKVLDNETQLKTKGIHEMSKVYMTYKKPKVVKRNRNSNFAPSLLATHLANVEDLTECIEALKQRNPKASYVFNDAETVSELVQKTLDPEIQLQRQREMDIVLDSQEMHAGGFQELVSRYHLIEEVYENSQLENEKLIKTETVIPQRPAHPSTTKLPTPYGFEAKLSLMMSLLKNMSPDNPNRHLMETLVSICAQSIVANTNETEEESDEFGSVGRMSPRMRNHASHVGYSFFDQRGFNEDLEQEEPQPVFPQIFHLPKNSHNPSNRRTPFSNHEPSSDDEFSVE